MATRTISVAGGNYNATGTWDEGAVPTAADDVVARADGTSGPLHITAAAACRSADFTSSSLSGGTYSNTLTHDTGFSWSIGTSTANGTTALKLSASMTYAPVANASILWTSTSATQLGITCAGHTLGNTTFSQAGNYKFLDTYASAGSITHTRSTITTNGQAVTAGVINESGTIARSFDMTNSTVTLSNTATPWNGAGGSNLTLTTTGSTLILSATSPTFGSNGLTFGAVSFTGSGTGTITGTLVCTTLTKSSGTLVLPAGVTVTVTTPALSGVHLSRVTIQSSSAGSPATLSDSSGTNLLQYVNIKDVAFTGGATWQAKHVTDQGGNSGISFLPVFSGERWGLVMA